MMSKLLYNLNNQWHKVSCFLCHPWTQISKFCFLRLPDLSKLVFCWPPRRRPLGFVCHAFISPPDTSILYLQQKPTSVRWAILIHFMMRMERYFPAFCTDRPTWAISGGGFVWNVHHYHHQGLSAGLYWLLTEEPTLDWSHRCLQCFANLNRTGPNSPVRSFLHLLFGRPCFLVHSLAVHSFALMVQRLSDSRAMWPAHLCFAFLIALKISLTPVSWRIQVFRFRSRRIMPRIMRSILRCATASLNVHTTVKGF